MLSAASLQEVVAGGRIIGDATTSRGDPKLGVLTELPGTWSNTEGFEGHAWNMIALPFGAPGKFGDFRLLLNQANETLVFDLVDLGVPNRGAAGNDQHLAALRYMQSLDQVAATDAASAADGSLVVPATPDTNDTPKGSKRTPEGQNVGIHSEPGLFLHLANLAGPPTNLNQPGPDIGRVASIPHGDAILALGFSPANFPVLGAPNLADPGLKAAFAPLPIGLAGPDDLSNQYFGPYAHFRAFPFQGLFDPNDPLALLSNAISTALPGSQVIETTTFSVDSLTQGGITNIPFVTSQANATRVQAVFWIQRLKTAAGDERLVLQYAQRVLLEFFPRGDGQPGLIQWPHISINTMIRQLD